MQKTKIGVIVGSLRKESFSKKIANIMIENLPEEYEAEIIEIGNLQMFHQDLEFPGKTPKEWKVFRNTVRQKDAFLFVTPEYNRSYPAVIKNALDIGSRPYVQNVWEKKPGAVISVSPGGMGGFGANHHLRQVLSYLNVYVMNQPEVYLGGVNKVLDAEGKLINESTESFLKSVVNAYVEWINKHR